MNIYVYSDESGVFDYIHNDYFIFGGIIFLSKKDKEDNERKYLHAEKCIRDNKISKNKELKASTLSNKNKGKLFRSLNNCYKFAVVIDQKQILKSIFNNKKSKQRYLDYAYKIGLKECLIKLINQNIINPSEIKNILVFVDEHTTATNGRYELREGLLNEFRYGTFNYEWQIFYPPVFPKLSDLQVTFCDSKNKTLIRAADIIANKIYHLTRCEQPIDNSNLFVTYLPK